MNPSTETKVHYKLIKYKKKGLDKILEDISEHNISVVGYWIFDPNYEKSLVLNRASLEIICAPSIGEEQAAKFELVFTAVRYIHSESQLKKG